MHVIIGQDTNAESQPLEATMPWIVKPTENDGSGTTDRVVPTPRRPLRAGRLRGAERLGAEGGRCRGRRDARGPRRRRGSAPAGEIDRHAWAGRELRGRNADRDLGSWRDDPGKLRRALRPGRCWVESAVSPAFMSPAAGPGVALRTPMGRRHIAGARRRGAGRVADRRLPGREGDQVADVSRSKADLRATAADSTS